MEEMSVDEPEDEEDIDNWFDIFLQWQRKMVDMFSGASVSAR